MKLDKLKKYLGNFGGISPPILAAILALALPCSALPDAPYMASTQIHNTASYAPLPPRNLDWRFLTAHSLYLSSIIFDTETTQWGLHQPCGFVEGGAYGGPHPSRVQMYRNFGIEFAAVTTMDYLFKRTHVPGLSYVGSTIGTLKHAHGGALWIQHCQ